ncbi:hypothetical protein Tco_0075464, partial [Tanacetum coccineum]
MVAASHRTKPPSWWFYTETNTPCLARGASGVVDRVDPLMRNLFGLRRKSPPKKFSGGGDVAVAGGSGGRREWWPAVGREREEEDDDV